MLWNGILWGIKAVHGGNENFSENLSNYRQCFWNFEKCHNTKAALKVSALNDISKAVAEAWNAIYSSIEWERRIVGKQLAKRAILHHLYENRVSVTQIYWSQWTPCCSKTLSIIQLWLLHVLKMLAQKMSSWKEKSSRKKNCPGFTVENTNSPLHCSETTHRVLFFPKSPKCWRWHNPY